MTSAVTPPDPLSHAEWHTPAGKEPPRRRTWWRRLRDRFREWRDRNATETSTPYEERRLSPPTAISYDDVPRHSFTLETPALGDAFNFKISVNCTWTVRATPTEEAREADDEEIQRFIADSRQGVREVVEERVRPIARRFAPYRAAEAEEALNRGMANCFLDGDLQAAVRIRVDVTQPVREKLQAVWLNRLLVDANADLQKASVELTGELQDRWHAVLLKGLTELGGVDPERTGWIAPYALALAEDPKNAAGYLKMLLEKRVTQAEMLLSDLSSIVIDRDHVDALEIAFQSQSALRAVLRELGVPAGNPNLDFTDAAMGGTDA